MKVHRIILIAVCLMLAACAPQKDEQESALATTLEETAEATQISETTNNPQPSEVFAIANSSAEELAPRWSSDSQSLYWVKVYGGPGQPEDNIGRTEFYQTELANPENSHLISYLEDNVYSPEWSPDTQHIAYIDEERVLHVMDRNRREISSFEGFFAYSSYPPIWLPNSEGLIAYSEGNLVLLKLDGTRQILFEGLQADMDDFGDAYALSSDGSKLVFVHQGDIYLLPVDGSEAQNLTNSPENEYAPSFSPDGSSIIFVVSNGERLSIYRMNSDGSEREQLLESRFNDFCPSWSPDGSRIAFLRGDAVEQVGSTAFVYELETEQISWIERPDGNSLGCPIWSPDNQWLAFENYDGLPKDIYVAEVASLVSVLEGGISYQVDFVPSNLSLNVYDRPDYPRNQIGTLSNGSSVELIGETVEDYSEAWQEIVFGEGTGWVNVEYLTGKLDTAVFCSDPSVMPVIEALQEAVRNRDTEAFASLIAPQGVYIALQGHTQYLQNWESSQLFNDYTLRFWGNDANSGEPIIKSMADDMLALLDRDLLGENLTVVCQDNQDDLSDNSVLYAVHLPDNETIYNFYSLMRPGAEGYELDWGAWGIAFSYWEGQPKIMALGHYHWTP